MENLFHAPEAFVGIFTSFARISRLDCNRSSLLVKRDAPLASGPKSNHQQK